MAGVAIKRTELTAPQLRATAVRTKDERASRRMLAIALVLEGADRTTAARNCGMDRQTLRDWVHRCNAKGLAGLASRRGSGRPRQLALEQMAELAGRVEAGPDLAPTWLGTAWCAGGARTPAAPDRGRLRRGPARAYGRQATGGTRLSAVVGAPAAPEVRCHSTGRF